ncbi:MAG: NAD(P)H-hydrate dehydratase [Clostridia bacterium]|nr:NAD(P)H-hydrate dehydratase [Clostridia bacterium]
MIQLFSNSQMRKADEYTINSIGIPSETLMHRAGTAIADEAQRVLEEKGLKTVLVVCGTGNNGGDGYVCAAELLSRGISCSVYQIEGRFSQDLEREWTRYKGPFAREIKGDIIIDCIFGTGLSRPVAGVFQEAIDAINASGAYIISADIPSGISGDSGLAMRCAVRADMTVTIQEYKTGLFLADGPDFCGRIIRKVIGIQSGIIQDTVSMYEPQDIKAFFPQRKHNSHKGTYGTACLVVGSDKYLGAAALATAGALRSGCGYTKVATSKAVREAIVGRLPQAIYLDDIDLLSKCILVGCGCGVSKDLYAIICNLLATYKGTLVIDADGLNSLAMFGTEPLKKAVCQVVVTPHVKEFARLFGMDDTFAADFNPVRQARSFADAYGCTVLLKSSSSVITDGMRTAVNATGNSALSKGGSGDMLAGFIAGSIARGLSAYDACVAGSYIMGRAAEIASERWTEYCVTARDVERAIPRAIQGLDVSD